jgi:hypothetical protein
MRPNAVARAKARTSSGSYLRKTATTCEVHTERAKEKEQCLQLRYLDIWRIGNSQGMTTVKQQEVFAMAAASVDRLGSSARSKSRGCIGYTRARREFLVLLENKKNRIHPIACYIYRLARYVFGS